MGTDVWDPVDSLRKSPQNDGRPICRPETKKDDSRGSRSRTSQFSAYNNYDASLECDRGQQYDPHPNSSFWSKSTESLSAPEFRWRRNPPANLPHPVGFSPSGLGWKKSANRTIPPVTSERLANVSRTQINESSSSCEQNSSLNQQLATKHSRAENAGSSLSPSTGQDPNVTGDSGGNSELRSSLQTSSPITPASLSSSFGGTHSKRTVSAYYGVQTTNKPSLRPNGSNFSNAAYSLLDEERGAHRPDGADCPDEHMWLYEDPQGRTQGTFSDAQMHDWLSAGIYFTPTLRVRRKCDDTFSTLADYTRLFGRVPFIPGPRIPPIYGGVNPNLLNGLASLKISHTQSATQSDTPDPALSNLGNQLSLASQSVGALDAAVSVATRSVTSAMPNSSRRSPYQMRLDHPDFQTTLGGSPQPQGFRNCAAGDLSDKRNSDCKSSVASAGGMCANSTLPVLPSLQLSQPMTTLTNSLKGMGFGGPSPEQQSSDSLVNGGIGDIAQPITSASTFMALASLISVNPALASLALPFSGPNPTGASTDYTAAALSPGFLAALAQYLNVQPHATGHQSVSPMQQLAETAQLAAQLAAMAGAHSPDQTPMQPAQALALAQLLMAQVNPSTNLQWSNHLKKDVVCDGTRDVTSDPADLRPDRLPNENSMGGTSVGRSNAPGTTSVDDARQPGSQPSHWPQTYAGSSGNRISPRAVDGRFGSKVTHEVGYSGDNTGNNTDRSKDNSLRPGIVHPNRQQSQGKIPNQAISPRSAGGSNKSKHQNSTVPYDSATFRDVQAGSIEIVGSSSSTHTSGRWADGLLPDKSHSTSGHTHSQRQGFQSQQPTAKQPSSSGQWATKVKQTPTKFGTSASTRASADQIQARSGANSHLGSKGSSVNNTSRKTKLTQQASVNASNARSPLKTDSSQLSQRSLNAQTKDTAVVPPENPTRSAVVVPKTDPDHTAESELERLTHWCQTRLSSVPMREKVDIPTVVELLATLDAPYEVERTVQIFLGESARTSLFVKEFLDRRRPFWQLHRERRERESMTKSPTKNDVSGLNSTRSAEKKKNRNNGGGNAENGGVGSHSTKQSSGSNGCNGGLTSYKTGSSQSHQVDQNQDNQWHHIKPKGSHNRKGKKEKNQ
ncbi:unnamed protein product [Calicophoron daubneyi]